MGIFTLLSPSGVVLASAAFLDANASARSRFRALLTPVSGSQEVLAGLGILGLGRVEATPNREVLRCLEVGLLMNRY